MTPGRPDPRPPYVDLITLKSGDCMDFFARNWQGLHVPIATMNLPELWRAYWRWQPMKPARRWQPKVAA